MIPLAGQKLRASDLRLVFSPIVGFGSRDTNGTLTTLTEQPYMRVDDIPVVSGQSYEISTSPLIFESSVAADEVQVFIRTSTAGAATIASTQLSLLSQPSKTASLAQNTAVFFGLYNATVTGSLSVLMSYVRAAGTGNVRINAVANIRAEFSVKWVGNTPLDTGVNL